MTKVKIDKIIRSKRKTIGLEVTGDAGLIIRAPKQVSLDYIERVVKEKKDWIQRRQEVARKRQQMAPPRRFVSGEGYWYLGNAYPLVVIDKAASPLSFDGNFNLSRRHLLNASDILAGWYRETARWVIGERAEHYATVYGLRYRKITITSARKRWGSCNAGGNLCFSWRLVMAPLKIIDYVVVHELAHLKEKNHSKRFWDLVGQMDPDYKQDRRWLRENGHVLTI